MAQHAAWQGLLPTGAVANLAVGGPAANSTGGSRGVTTQQSSRKPPAKGKGLGGAGTSNKCVPCTIAKMENMIASEQLERQVLTKAVAQGFAGFVQATKSHHNQCPYCKCADCKKIYYKGGELKSSEFVLRKNCQGMRKG
jgi:hypothetical protein